MRRIIAAIVFLVLPWALPASAAPTTVAPGSREVEVCFVLDTTGSMSGLLEAAKQKLWFIASEIASAPSRPRVKFCLLAFRDRGDAYVTRHLDLSDDLDSIHAELMALTADGGGDAPEAVNQALQEAVEDSAWSADPSVLKLIFLVGDAPPHTDYDEPQYPEIAARAAARGIIINPVLCGSDSVAETAFARVANTTRGRSARLTEPARVAQTGTPMDQDLAVLGDRLERSFIPYDPATGPGAEADASEPTAASSRLGHSIAADRAAFIAARGRMHAHRIDLIEAIDSGRVDATRIDPASLPPTLRSMTESELHEHLSTVRTDRAALRRLIGELLQERRTLLATRTSDSGDGFDRIVAETVQMQLSRQPTQADPDTHP